MKRLELKPSGFPMTLAECPPGFFLFENHVFLKSEYGHCESYCESGEMFWGGTTSLAERAKLQVQPLESEWTES